MFPTAEAEIIPQIGVLYRAFDQRLKTLVLGPQDYRLREPLDVLDEPGLLKLAQTRVTAWPWCT